MDRLVILGGSSPFTAALIGQLISQNMPPFELVLHGRNVDRLRVIASYAEARLKGRHWNVVSEPRMNVALDGATIVLHQIRYGQLSGRAKDERLAESLGFAADETLGPGALRRMLCLRNPLADVCETIKRCCPNAWVINLTNPLSIVTSLMFQSGLKKCFGLCELPKTTARQAALQVGFELEQLDWSYAGLNHRGFIVALNTPDQDGIKMLADQQSDSCFEGFSSALIGELQAIPTKYFHLMLGDFPSASGRARTLMDLSESILKEIRERPNRIPTSLAIRNTTWYDEAVVPALKAISGNNDCELVVNLVQPSGITREIHAQISCDSVTPLGEPPVSAGAELWIKRFEQHERSLLALAGETTVRNLHAAIALDPLVPNAAIEDVAQALQKDGIPDLRTG